MRMKIGDKVEIIYDSKLYIGEIIFLDDLVKCRLIEEKREYNELDIRVTICQSLVKEEKMDLILQKCVELGMNSFIHLKTKNSIIKNLY